MRVASLLFLALALPAVAAAQANATLGADAQIPQVTLPEAIERANKVQPTVVQARASIDIADAQRRVVTGSWLPSLNATGSTGYLYSEGQGRVDPITGQFVTGNTENTSLNTGVSTSWDLFTGFRRGADKRAAVSQQNAAEAGLANAEWQQRFTTSNQFFTALAARQILEVRGAAVRRAEEQLPTLRRLWAGESLSDKVGAIGPKSPRASGPEMLIGGYVPAIVERIAKWGDGYMAPGGGEPESMLKMWREIERAWREAGRSGHPRWVGASYFALGPQALEHDAIHPSELWIQSGARSQTLAHLTDFGKSC